GVAKTLLHKGAAGLTNAVLRKLAVARDRQTLPMPASGDLADDLATVYSHPTWMVRRWLDRMPEAEVIALMETHNRVPRFALRVNRLRADTEAVVARLGDLEADPAPSEWSPDLVTVGRLGPAMGLVAEGVCAVQDEAAALVVSVLDPQPGETVLDGAAAPGGKAIYAAERMQNDGRVVAVDLHPAKTDLIWRAAHAHGVSIVEPVAADLRDWEPDGPFDRVLLDAPCSGTGVLGKRADLRWRRAPADLDDLTTLQDALLDAAAPHVRPGGLLVYSTCSMEPEENEARTEAFVSRHPEFSREDVGDLVPTEMRTEAGDFQALPHVHGTDGAYAARLRRRV
ncbi:MAG: SAM-dependent methyltransferase, partial [Bacteroidota bacterium]